MHLFELVKRIKDASIWRSSRWNSWKNMSITVPILSSCLLDEASSSMHITNIFALRITTMLCLKMQNPIILGDSENFFWAQICRNNYDESKGFSAWGVNTPNWNCNFSKVQNFPLLEVFFSHWGVLILLTKQEINNMKDASGQLGHILLSLLYI